MPLMLYVFFLCVLPYVAAGVCLRCGIRNRAQVHELHTPILRVPRLHILLEEPFGGNLLLLMSGNCMMSLFRVRVGFFVYFPRTRSQRGVGTLVMMFSVFPTVLWSKCSIARCGMQNLCLGTFPDQNSVCSACSMRAAC